METHNQPVRVINNPSKKNSDAVILLNLGLATVAVRFMCEMLGFNGTNSSSFQPQNPLRRISVHQFLARLDEMYDIRKDHGDW